MEDYIKRETVIAFLENIAASQYLIQCFQDKERFPAENVKLEQHGEWKNSEILSMMCCSECGVGDLDIHRNKFDYCPYCGAKMDGGKDNDK